MRVVFHKILIDNCWSWRRYTRVITRAAVVAAIHTISHAWHGDASMGLAFVTDDIAEMLKNATHFC